ncbi:MAG: class I SAM-dependent methyltransferase, partial [Anaerolineales bacterium]|nr:class I SAM-dependent methyltransferase [Anaerolineales bacterium]
TVPMAKLVGKNGKVIAVDMQSKMLSGLQTRAEQADLREQIELHQCTQDQIGISGPVDFILAFWMVHEVHHRREFLDQIYQLLKEGGRLLIAEPYLHVSGKTFQEMIAELQGIGFSVEEHPRIGFSRSILVQK